MFSMVKRYLTVGLLLALAGSLVWGFWNHGKASTLRTELKAAQADLAASRGHVQALQDQAVQRNRTAARQSAERAKAAKSVQDTLKDTHREEAASDEDRTELTPAQLDRLRRVTESANRGIRDASKLH